MRYRATTPVKDYLTTEMVPPRATGETTLYQGGVIVELQKLN
jgi:hypothetical protein